MYIDWKDSKPTKLESHYSRNVAVKVTMVKTINQKFDVTLPKYATYIFSISQHLINDASCSLRRQPSNSLNKITYTCD